jgi:hypothetical protein
MGISPGDAISGPPPAVFFGGGTGTAKLAILTLAR